MAKSSKNRMSKATYNAKLEELETLKKRRKEVAEKLKEAREQGDLSENAEYDAAREEQREVETRIKELEDDLKDVIIYDEKGRKGYDKDVVQLGSIVRVYDMTYDEEMEFHIVDTKESNSLEWKISDKSPAGGALMNKKVDDVVTFEAPAGTMQYRILQIA